ncbi:hypothetical protein GCM10012275_41380 [Longimycelium tulufanense]|uniref:Dye decolorizing peroxidase n=1 Tax=Longimycelium tulufanense TaxID=907463 RepID=A0A8J3FXW9_9PSEU|nr:Dyp-type peroxidase [Longimycelium tulufanense]GGM66596.1 hypothetical protein GCM10012275_41380 [Longimycelium tulufanense]
MATGTDGPGTDEGRPDEQPTAAQSALGRRRLFGLLGAAGVTGAALGAGVTAAREPEPAAPTPTSGAPAPPADPRRQPGVATPLPAQLRLLAFDLDPAVAEGKDRRALARVLAEWQQVTDQLRSGDLGRAERAEPFAGLDTRDATVTIGFGASLLGKLGLDGQRPEQLVDMPEFPGDQLDAARGDGDVLLQVCAEDELVASGAADLLRRASGGALRLRWAQNGFRALEARSGPNPPARNLMGQVDGVNNPEPGTGLFDTTVWVPEWARPQWMVNGTYLVVRRIRMVLDDWFAQPVQRRDDVIGRSTATGAPLGRQRLEDQVDLVLKRPDGRHAVPLDAHIRLASPTKNGGARMYRRPFNYDDGYRADGTRDAGLLFLAFQADPRRGFIPVMEKLAKAGDALNKFIAHEASGLYAIPPAAPKGGYVGQQLLES